MVDAKAGRERWRTFGPSLLAHQPDAEELVTAAARAEEHEPILVLERDRALSIDRHPADGGSMAIASPPTDMGSIAWASVFIAA